MRIQHNIMAMNSYRNYNTNVNSLSQNLEKLSSGYRINRAGDDAAGLAISEKMRAQITGLDAAQKNVKDGVSLVKTAEGALQEVQDMMNRMVYLAEQSANGTYDDSVDRKALQEEVNALTAEIDRIAESTNFNGKALLNGDLAGAKAAKINQTPGTTGLTGGSNAVRAKFTMTLDTASITVAQGKELVIGDTTVVTSTDTASASKSGSDLDGIIKNAINGQDVEIDGVTYTAATADGKVITFEEKAEPTADGKATAALTSAVQAEVLNGGSAVSSSAVGISAVTEGKKAVAGTPNGTAAKTEIDYTGLTGADVIGSTIKIGSTTYEFYKTGDAAPANGNTGIAIAEGATAADIADALHGKTPAVDGFTLGKDGGKVTFTETNTTDGTISTNPTIEQKSASGLTLQIGDTNDAHNQLTVTIDAMDSATLFGGAIDIDDQANAQTAIDTIKTAINKVSEQRGKLGAIQNRLEHTQNNLSTMEENIQDAESTIRDTDVADEMMAYTKNNILIQSAQAMLAQANAVPQGVLQLLQ